MPYEKGGRADKKGNKYEINCIVYELLKVLDGSNYKMIINIWNRLEWKCETVKKQNRKHYNEMQYLPLTEKNIGAICKHFQVSYSIGEKVVFVRTSFTSWIVCLDGNAVSKLFHENYKPCKNEYSKRSKLKGIEGYHVQKMPSSNFYRVICYIKKHDDSLIKQWGKRNRIEKIFDQIEEELEKTKNQIS